MEETIIKTIFVTSDPGRAFDFIIDPANFGLWKGYGKLPPITRIVNSGPRRVGQVDRVEHSDGTTSEVEVIEIDRPKRYRLRVLQIPFPTSLFVSEAVETWDIQALADGTTEIKRTWQLRFKDGMLATLIGRQVMARHVERAVDAHSSLLREHLSRS